MSLSGEAWGRVLREWAAAGMIGLGLSQITFGPYRRVGVVIVIVGAVLGAIQLTARWQHRRSLRRK